MAEEQNRLKEYGKVVVFSIIGASTMVYLSCDSCARDFSRFLSASALSSLMWATMWIGNGELAHQLDIYIPWMKLPLKRLFVGIISTIIFTVAVAFTMLKLWEFSWEVKFDNYSQFITISLIITFLISLFLHGREFLLQWRQSAVDAERYQKESMSATYESLKSQVNPHFLFNSLNALTNLVYEDQDKAVKFIKQLSEVYRYVLDTRNSEVVPLAEELKFLNSYLFLQQIRFGTKLTIDIKLNGLKSMVAPLALQMLIENAVKHNEVSEENPLHISIYEVDSFIVIENNLQRKSQLGESSSGLGLDNISKRYEFISDKKVEVVQTDKLFKVKVPVINPK